MPITSSLFLFAHKLSKLNYIHDSRRKFVMGKSRTKSSRELLPESRTLSTPGLVYY